MADALSPEDAAALARLREHLRGMDPDPYQCEVRVEPHDGGGYHVCARLRSIGDDGTDSLVARSSRPTVAAALVEVGRRIGVAL